MNGGLGSRVWVATYDSCTGARGDWSTRWLSVLTPLREEFGYAEDGIRLVWLVDWVSRYMLEPAVTVGVYRVRAEDHELRVKEDGTIIGYKTTSNNYNRIAIRLKGIGGDIWVPVDLKKNRQLRLASGEATRKLHDLIFEQDYRAAGLKMLETYIWRYYSFFW